MTLQQLLAEAELQYHKLLTGKAVVEFRDQNGELMRYNIANASRLAAYIQELKNRINGPTSGPMRVFF